MILRATRYAKIRGSVVTGFPVIFNDDYEIDWLSLEYFLCLNRSVSVSSLRLYGSHLADFLAQLKVDDIRVDDVNDDWLIAYKAELLGRKNSSGKYNSRNYAAQVLRTVIHYMYWLEENKFIRNVIGGTSDFKVRIKVGDQGNRGINHPLTKNGSVSKRTVTPRKEWIEAVKMYGPKREDLAARFALMIDWARSVGLRAMEVCALTRMVLPLRVSGEKALVDGRNLKVSLPRTKGGKESSVWVSPQLVIMTWDYIDLYRSDIVEIFTKRFKSRYEVYEDPDEVFLSNKTGQAINSRAFSNAIRKAFLFARRSRQTRPPERRWRHPD